MNRVRGALLACFFLAAGLVPAVAVPVERDLDPGEPATMPDLAWLTSLRDQALGLLAGRSGPATSATVLLKGPGRVLTMEFSANKDGSLELGDWSLEFGGAARKVHEGRGLAWSSSREWDVAGFLVLESFFSERGDTLVRTVRTEWFADQVLSETATDAASNILWKRSYRYDTRQRLLEVETDTAGSLAWTRYVWKEGRVAERQVLEGPRTTIEAFDDRGRRIADEQWDSDVQTGASWYTEAGDLHLDLAGDRAVHRLYGPGLALRAEREYRLPDDSLKSWLALDMEGRVGRLGTLAVLAWKTLDYDTTGRVILETRWKPGQRTEIRTERAGERTETRTVVNGVITESVIVEGPFRTLSWYRNGNLVYRLLEEDGRPVREEEYQNGTRVRVRELK